MSPTSGFYLIPPCGNPATNLPTPNNDCFNIYEANATTLGSYSLKQLAYLQNTLALQTQLIGPAIAAANIASAAQGGGQIDSTGLITVNGNAAWTADYTMAQTAYPVSAGARNFYSTCTRF